jgi:pimeloyl-ACP methyl ester carboxylesterase
MKEGFLDSMGYKVHHCMWGSKGPKVLLIHSMGMDGHSMDKLAESLKEEYQLLSLTILDHGDSDPPKEQISLPDHAEVMRECYKQLGFEPSVLIGHSVGGMMGMVLAAEYPDEYKGMVLVDIAPFESSGGASRPAPPEYFESRVEAKKWLADRYPGFTEYYVKNRLDHAFKEKEGKYYLKPRGDKVRSGLATDLWPYLERVKCPIQLQKGVTSDLVKPETRARMAKMPNVEIIDVEGTGHMIPQDVPEKFEELIRGVLNRVY